MEEINSIVASALNSIGAVQPLVIAAAAGFILKDANKILIFTIGALLVNGLVGMVRSGFGGTPVGDVVQSNLTGFFGLTMKTFLIQAVSFALVIAIVFAAKLQLKKL